MLAWLSFGKADGAVEIELLDGLGVLRDRVGRDVREGRFMVASLVSAVIVGSLLALVSVGNVDKVDSSSGVG